MKVTTKLVYTQGVEEEVFPSIDHNYGYVAPLRVSYMGFFRLVLHRGEGGHKVPTAFFSEMVTTCN